MKKCVKCLGGLFGRITWETEIQVVDNEYCVAVCSTSKRLF